MKNSKTSNSAFTGEFFVPGATEMRIEQDHIARYIFALKYVKSCTVLDIACGVGYGSAILACREHGATKVFGVDIREDNVEVAKRNYGSDQIVFNCGDILTYKAEPFDVIVCFETIEHIAAYREALSNLFRLLRIGGKLLISSPNRVITSPSALSLSDKPQNRYHNQEFTIEELRNELENVGFTVGPHSVYGQRQAIFFKNQRFQSISRRFWRQEIRSNPVVTSVRHLCPRYFLLVATK